MKGNTLLLVMAAWPAHSHSVKDMGSVRPQKLSQESMGDSSSGTDAWGDIGMEGRGWEGGKWDVGPQWKVWM